MWAGLVGRRRNFAGPLRSFRSRKHQATWESAREAENGAVAGERVVDHALVLDDDHGIAHVLVAEALLEDTTGAVDVSA